MTEIGSAYVKVRPDTRSFQSETSSALKQPLVSIGKLITGALAIKGGIDFGKELIADAARVQKSAEVIRSEFGKSGESIIQFADKAGFALGLTEHVTEDTAARLGILFGNIGIGKDQAAAMTLNLEKLAASIAAIRGKDPADILGTLPLALSGSLRGLRQLGFAFTPVQIKNEALQLGLIKTTKQALDPGARAIAIYGLATKDLSGFQAEAAKHSDDAYNVQKRLSAEWDHAKELLGAGLLPELASAGNEFSKWIDKQSKSGELQHDFNVVARDGKAAIKDVAGAIKTAAGAFHEFSDLVGGDHNAVKTLADAFLLIYTRSKLIKWGVITAGEKAVGDTATISAGKVGLLSGALTRLKKLGPIGVIIALSVIPPNKKGQDALDKFHLGFLGKLPFGIGDAEQQIARAATVVGGKAGTVLADAALAALGKSVQKKGMTPAEMIAKLAREGKTDLTTGLPLPGNAKKAGNDLGKQISDAVAEGVKANQRKVAIAVADSALTAAKEAVAAAKDALTQAIADSKTTIAASILSAKQNLNTLGSQLASDVAAQLDKRAQSGLDLPPILKKRLAELQARIKAGQGGVETQRLAQELQNQIATRANLAGAGTSQKDALTRRFADLSDLAGKGAISRAAFDKGADEILKKVGVTAQVILRTQGVAAKDQFLADFTAYKAQKDAIDAGPRAAGTGFEQTIVKPLDTLREQAKLIATAQHAVATAQLDQQKKAADLLAKIEAKLPSKHTSEELNALLRKQAGGPSKTAADARTAAHGRHGG